MKKLVKEKSHSGLVGDLIRIFLYSCIIAFSYSSYIKIKSQKVQLKNQIKSITQENTFLIEDNQSLMCDNDRLYTVLDSLPLGSPIYDTLRVSSNYGWRRNPLGKGWRFHSGVDIYAAWSDTVYASGDGIIKKAYWFGGYGRCVVISHAGEYESYYAHLYRIFIKEGDSIKKGEPIGRAGNSGAVTGPHLHYEIRKGEKTTDPLKYIDVLYRTFKPEEFLNK